MPCACLIRYLFYHQMINLFHFKVLTHSRFLIIGGRKKRRKKRERTLSITLKVEEKHAYHHGREFPRCDQIIIFTMYNYLRLLIRYFFLLSFLPRRWLRNYFWQFPVPEIISPRKKSIDITSHCVSSKFTLPSKSFFNPLMNHWVFSTTWIRD